MATATSYMTYPFSPGTGFSTWSAAMGLATGAAITLAVVIGIIIYLYAAFALYTIAVKLGRPNAWMAWIPIVNLFYLPQVAGHHWAWGFLVIMPPFYFIAMVIWNWQIYEMRDYSGVLALIPLLGLIPVIGLIAWLAHLIVMGLVAWHDTDEWNAQTDGMRHDSRIATQRTVVRRRRRR